MFGLQPEGMLQGWWLGMAAGGSNSLQVNVQEPKKPLMKKHVGIQRLAKKGWQGIRRVQHGYATLQRKHVGGGFSRYSYMS